MTGKKAVLMEHRGLANHPAGRGQEKLPEEEKLVLGFEG